MCSSDLDIHLELRSLGTSAQLQAIREDRLNIGFVILPLEEDDLAVEKVASEPLVVALPQSHRLASLKRIPLLALAGEPSILFPRPLSPGYYDHLIGICRNAGFSLHVAHEMDSIYTALALVTAGLGLSLVPTSLTDSHRNGIVFRELETAPQVECAIVYKGEDRKSTRLNSSH